MKNLQGKIKYATLLLLLFNIKAEDANTQETFSKVFDYGLVHSEAELLIEPEGDAYYAIGYAQVPNAELGVHVSCHDKKSGNLKHSTVFTIPNQSIFLNGRPPVFQIKNNLVFACKTKNIILKLQYNIVDHKIVVLDTIVNPLPGNYYLFDMLLEGDTSTYQATLIQDTTNISSIINRFPDGGTKHIYIKNPPDFVFNGGKLLKMSNGNYIVFGSISQKSNFYSNFLSIIEVDTSGTVIREYRSPRSDGVFQVMDAVAINDHNVLVLTMGIDYDTLWKATSFPNPIYKFDLDTWKPVWRKQYTMPHTSKHVSLSSVIKGHRHDEFLYCTTVAAEGVSRDSFFTKARIVKIRSDGSKVWQKDYFYYHGDRNSNSFISLLATSDGNYLLGGSAVIFYFKTWLVKIDEEGNIVPVDTTSSNTEWQDPGVGKHITIYPNPAGEFIVINQGETAFMTYNLLDTNGRLVRSMHMEQPHQHVSWDISDLPPGTYVLQMVDKNICVGIHRILKQ